jgi:hypothetical protein
MLLFFINSSYYIRDNRTIILLDPNAMPSQEVPEFMDNRGVYNTLYLFCLVPEILAEIFLQLYVLKLALAIRLPRIYYLIVCSNIIFLYSLDRYKIEAAFYLSLINNTALNILYLLGK